LREHAAPETTRITLQVISIGLLIGGAFWILQFFVPAILWATIFVITTWPLFQAIQRRLWNRRPLAILVIVSALLVIVILPCVFAVLSIVDNTDTITAWAESLRHAQLPPPPDMLSKIPLIGSRAVEAWHKAQALTAEGLANSLAPYTSAVVAWFIAKAGSVGLLLLQFLLTLVIAIVLYANGESAGQTVRAFCRRLAGARGEEIANLAAKAIRSVALGVLVTALAQAILSGIGLALAGISSAALLTAIVFVLCLCQIGPGLVLIPVIIWLFYSGQMVSGGVLVAFAVVIIPLDNFLRPVLIRKGADMPLILVFIGVIGGLLAMGVIGLFIGPVILAVANTLLKLWISTEPADEVPQ